MPINNILWAILVQWQLIHCSLLDQRQALSSSIDDGPAPSNDFIVVSNSVTFSGEAAASFTNDPLALLHAPEGSATPAKPSPAAVISIPLSMPSASSSAAHSLLPPDRAAGAVGTITAPPIAIQTCQPTHCYGEATVGFSYESDPVWKRL